MLLLGSVHVVGGLTLHGSQGVHVCVCVCVTELEAAVCDYQVAGPHSDTKAEVCVCVCVCVFNDFLLVTFQSNISHTHTCADRLTLLTSADPPLSL